MALLLSNQYSASTVGSGESEPYLENKVKVKMPQSFYLVYKGTITNEMLLGFVCTHAKPKTLNLSTVHIVISQAPRALMNSIPTPQFTLHSLISQ